MKVQLTVIERKRKALLVLPLVLIPFLTLAFWALGGGKETDAAKEDKSGLNMQLPNAQLGDDSDKTKLSFYEAEEKGASSQADTSTGLSFYTEKSPGDPFRSQAGRHHELYDPTPPVSFQGRDSNEEKIYQKLSELNTALAQSSSSAKSEARPTLQTKDHNQTDNDIKRLTAVMQHKQADSESDPELEQLNGMMDKILDIQHPERAKEKQLASKVESGNKSFAVYQAVRKASQSLLDTSISPQRSKIAFYSLTGNQKPSTDNAIEATVYQTQTLVNGSVITFRLLTDLQISGKSVPKGSLLSGSCSLNEERLEVLVSSVRSGSSIYPVQLEAYDLDGIRGLYIPGTINREVAKGVANNATQMLQLSTLDPSLKAQATTLGLDAVKSLLSKKTKLVRVLVKGGYKVLLKQKNA